MGRWERTHAAVRAAALELFTAQGYDATTVAQVARRAGVSEMTLFRHFATKEALLLDDPFDPLIAAAVRSRPSDEPPLRAVLEGIRHALDALDPADGEGLRARLRVAAEAKTLHGALERNSSATTAAIVAALVDRGAPLDAARVVAAAVIGGLSAALLDWSRTDDDDLRDVVRRALDALLGG